MKKLLSVLSAIVIFSITMYSGNDDNTELKVMSYNVRMGVAKDGTNSWQHRCPATIAMLDAQKPDVFGVQEASRVERHLCGCR